MEIEIKNTDNLLAFVRLESTTPSQAVEVIEAVLNVTVMQAMTKDQIITETEHWISSFCNNTGRKVPTPPFFPNNDILRNR